MSMPYHSPIDSSLYELPYTRTFINDDHVQWAVVMKESAHYVLLTIATHDVAIAGDDYSLFLPSRGDNSFPVAIVHTHASYNSVVPTRDDFEQLPQGLLGIVYTPDLAVVCIYDNLGVIGTKKIGDH